MGDLFMAVAAAALALLVGAGGAAWALLDGSAFRPSPNDSDKRTDAPVTPDAARPPPAVARRQAPPLAAVASAGGPGQIFAGRLRESGAGACASQVDQLAAGNNVSVAHFNTVSTWATSAVDKRLVSVTLGQKYPDGSAVPYAATSVIAAPNPAGECDAVAVQVVPSSLPCAKVRENLGTSSRLIGDLAGIPLVSDGEGQTMLVPAPNNTCVLVGLRVAYAK